MTLKKILSVFLAVLMLFGVCSVGIVGTAAEIDYNAQYKYLAEALKKDHVRTLENYTVTNTALNNGTEGFDTEANGFAYEHRVVARDNQNGDILVAANRFYFIAESLISTKHGKGCYDADTLVKTVTKNVKKYFDDGTSTEVIYEDVYGKRYYPTEEDMKAYNDAVSLIEAAGGIVDINSLGQYGVRFAKKTEYDYYNVDAVLKYFVGNVLKVNSGNWYHRFSFVVETSVDNILEEASGIGNIANPVLTMRTAVYELSYKREYNETLSKSFFSFEKPTLKKVWEDFGAEFDFERESADLTPNVDGHKGLLWQGQASAFMIKISFDTTTVPYLTQVFDEFRKVIDIPYDSTANTRWDTQFQTLSDEGVAELMKKYPTILKYAADLNTNYSNEALTALYGDRVGSMVTFAYYFKRSDDAPTRTVRGEAKYVATADKLNQIIYDLDALVSPRDGEQGADMAIANRVAAVLNMFLKTEDLLAGTPFAGMKFSTIKELLGMLVNGMLFHDDIVNMLIEKVYPMVIGLINDMAESAKGAGDLLKDIINNIINNNDLAIYPDTLGSRILTHYPGQFDSAARTLINAGKDWTKVKYKALKWGIENAPLEQRGEKFLTAASAALSGFTKLLVTLFCGDYDYRNKDRGNRYNQYYDRNIVAGATLRSQGMYTKVLIPLYRVLGIPSSIYKSSKDFHAAVDSNENLILKYALEPIIKWVTDILAEKPFETLMALIPNLVYFLQRKGTDPTLEEHKKDWIHNAFNGLPVQERAHQGFESVQTYNLYDILGSCFLCLDLSGGIVVMKDPITKLLGSTANMLTSLNSILDSVLKLTYKTDSYHDEIACYVNNDTGEILLDSDEKFGLLEFPEVDPNHPDAYVDTSMPIGFRGEMKYYSDTTGKDRSLVKDDAHPIEHINRVYDTKPFKLPSIAEKKLFNTGTVYEPYNTIHVDNPGLVFQFLLRYVLSALGYKYDNFNDELPTVIECFGLDLNQELFSGLKLGDIINNVMLHPDEALCALLELFYTNEFGDYYKHKNYTYPVDPIDYHQNTLLNPTINPGLTYGTPVKYSKYWTEQYANDFIASIEPLLTDIMLMLGKTEFADGLGPYLGNMIDGFLTDDILNKVFNLLYQILGGVSDKLNIDIGAILANVLDVQVSTTALGKSLVKMIGYETEASRAIQGSTSWKDFFNIGTQVDPATGNEVPAYGDKALNWGLDKAEEHGQKKIDVFLKTMACLAAPASFLIRFLFMDQHLDLLGLIDIPSYAGYQYAFIGLLEALSCPGILTYEDYYERSNDPDCGDANSIYYLLSPIGGLVDKVIEDPITTILNLIPNFLFFVSIGGLNDLLNNLVHIVYVLLDILKPILNGYDLLNGLISNIDIKGMKINLALPLDLDFNALISDIIGALVGDALTIKGVKLTLPYIDFHTLCCGTLQKFNSQEVRTTVHLNAAGGGALLTAILRLVTEVVFMEENKVAISQIINNAVADGTLDPYDLETLYIIIDALFDLIEQNQVIDMVLYAVYMIVTKLVPIADTLSERLVANNMTINDVIAAAKDPQQLVAIIKQLAKDPQAPETPNGEIGNMNALASFFLRIKAYFEKLILFFKKMFGMA